MASVDDDTLEAPSKGSQYLLPADTSDSERLNLQHHAITQAMGNRLWISPLDIENLQGHSVLDSGTGTGIWLQDLQERLQRLSSSVPCQLYGTDISDKQFPPSLSSDDQRIFQVANCVSLPSDWSNKFKLVHQRLLVVALSKPEWTQCINEIYRVLESGGYASFCEATFGEHHFSDDGPSGQMARFASKAMQVRNMIPHIGSQLPRLLKEAGFVDVIVEDIKVDVCRLHGEQQKINHATFKDVFVKLGRMFTVIDPNRSQAEYDEMVADIETQWDQEEMYFPLKCISARKP